MYFAQEKRPLSERKSPTRLPAKRRKRTHLGECSHTCQVSLQRLFLERQEWQAVAKSLQEQINVLGAWQRSPRAITNDGKTPSGGGGPGGGSDSAAASNTRPEMPNEHPLYAFVQACLAQPDWDARARCGAVRRAYEEWWSGRQNDTGGADGKCHKKKINHVRFAREMTKYFPRQGCTARAFYIGIELLPEGSDEETPRGDASVSEL
jgi:hypothetical protein